MKSFVHWDSRSNSTGFYQIIDDEMIGAPSLNRIRRYGTVWFHENEKYRMYLYESRSLEETGRSIRKIENFFKEYVCDPLPEKLKPPYLHHNFAEDNGIIRDQVIMWKLNNTEMIHIYDQFYCVQITQVNHIIRHPSVQTAKIDFHFLVEQKPNQ